MSDKNAFLSSISSLASGNSVMIRFIHEGDHQEHVFCSTINELSGSRLAFFDNDAPVIDDNNSFTKSVIKNLYKRAEKILSHETNCKTFGVPKGFVPVPLKPEATSSQ